MFKVSMRINSTMRLVYTLTVENLIQWEQIDSSLTEMK